MAGIKKNSLTVGSIIILVLSVISFVFIPAMVQSGHESKSIVLGKWKNKTLENDDGSLFIREYRNLYRMAELTGSLSTDNQFQRELIEQRMQYIAFNAAMVQLAAQTEALSAGFHLPNKAINKALLSVYTDRETGAYSQRLYEQTSEQARLAYRKEVSDSLIAERYIEDMFGAHDNLFGLKTSSAETAFIQKMGEKERIFKYVIFEDSQFPKEKIRAYGAEHADLFAEHNLLLLTFSSEEDANKVAASIQKGEITFEDAIATHSTKAGTDTSGKLLSPYRTAVNQTFPESKNLDAVLNLGVDEISPVVKTDRGYAIVKCTAPVKAADFTDAETEERVFSYMKTNERGLIEDYLEEKAKVFADTARGESGEDGFVKTAERNELVVQTSNPFPINYGSAGILSQISSQTDSLLTAGIRNENFFKKIFALKKNEISDPILIGSNVAVLQLYEETEAAEDVRNNIGTLYNRYVSLWYPQYPLALMRFEMLPWGQQTLLDFVLKNPQFTDNFRDAIK